MMCIQCSSYEPVIFEHPDYGTFVVASMVDIDFEVTEDIELAMEVVCPTPDGSGSMSVPLYVLAQGTLMRVGRLN